LPRLAPAGPALVELLRIAPTIDDDLVEVVPVRVDVDGDIDRLLVPYLLRGEVELVL